MTSEEKQLLLEDLSARLPYGVKIMFAYNGFRWDWEQTLEEIRKCDDGDYAINGWGIRGIKPYLRPLSSMTEEELEEFRAFHCVHDLHPYFYPMMCNMPNLTNMFDWLNAHHIDYRGLIPKGLALEAPEDMYD